MGIRREDVNQRWWEVEVSERGKRIRLGAIQLNEGEMTGLETDEGRLVCLARMDGAYRAIDDWCNHAGCLLSSGWLEKQGDKRLVVCPCHEVGFDLDSGENLTAPNIAGDQEAFRVLEEKGELWILVRERP